MGGLVGVLDDRTGERGGKPLPGGVAALAVGVVEGWPLGGRVVGMVAPARGGTPGRGEGVATAGGLARKEPHIVAHTPGDPAALPPLLLMLLLLLWKGHWKLVLGLLEPRTMLALLLLPLRGGKGPAKPAGVVGLLPSTPSDLLLETAWLLL